MISPKDLLLNPSESYVMGELNSILGKGADYRADIASVICTRLINFTCNYAESNTITPAITDRLTRFITDENAFTNDLQYIIVKKVINANKQKFQKLMLNPAIVKMAMNKSYNYDRKKILTAPYREGLIVKKAKSLALMLMSRDTADHKMAQLILNTCDIEKSIYWIWKLSRQASNIMVNLRTKAGRNFKEHSRLFLISTKAEDLC